ncbi:MAG TPA: 4'-phosphopantetheinyl transferase superfamily protein [Thermomicrobiales bacterium]|nr:4'-phosphopantetheinyl transferase superfamily protein [Thermomicrobiales bacterium]
MDLEEVRADLDPAELAAVALTPGERALLAALPADRRPDVFAALWTRKEALAKAAGRGLALPFHEIDVAAGGDPERWAGWGQVVFDGRGWSLRSLNVGHRFAAALAVEGVGDGVGIGVRWRERWPDGGDLPEG